MKKQTVNQFSLFGGVPVFDSPKPTSGLYRPSEENFFFYAKSMFAARHVTNNGPLVQELEKRLATLHGTKTCVTFCSGFMALQLSVYALALPGRSEVILPSATYRRMAAIVRWAGLEPRFTDIDPQTLGVNAALFRQHISAKTALLLGVHPIVNMSAVEELEALSMESGIPLLIDSVEAAYGKINGRTIGSFGIAEVFSMHASKFINGFEGGYLTTDSIPLHDKLKEMQAFGFKQKDTIVELGCNAKLNEIHAAMSLATLDELEEQIKRNKSIFDLYETTLTDLPLHIFRYSDNEERTWKNIVVRLDEDRWELSRDEILQLLQAENILARPYYTPPLHQVKKEVSFIDLPVTTAVTASTCILPSGAHVSEKDVADIGATLRAIYENRHTLKVAMQSRSKL